MKTCVIFGDLASDSSADNYPTVQICDRCAELDQARKENSQIVTTGEFDSSFGDSCEFCDKTYEEEQKETD